MMATVLDYFDLSKLKTLPPPYEILELVPCEPVIIKVLDYQIGKITIHPRWPGAPPAKEVLCVRIFTDKQTKPTFPHYWDITPKRLTYQLINILIQEKLTGKYLKIHRDIPGPKAHYSIQILEKPT